MSSHETNATRRDDAWVAEQIARARARSSMPSRTEPLTSEDSKERLELMLKIAIGKIEERDRLIASLCECILFLQHDMMV